jgi:hypothetical protein
MADAAKIAGVMLELPRRGTSRVDFEELLTAFLALFAIVEELERRIARLQLRVLDDLDRDATTPEAQSLLDLLSDREEADDA